MMGISICSQQRRNHVAQWKHFLTPVGTANIHFDVMLADCVHRICGIEQRSARLQLSQITRLLSCIRAWPVHTDAIFLVKVGQGIQLRSRLFPPLGHCFEDFEWPVATSFQCGLNFIIVMV